MRDIVADLRERLELAETAKRRHSSNYSTDMKALTDRYKQDANRLNAEIAAIKGMLDVETRRTAKSGGAQSTSAPELDIKDFLVKAVKESAKTKDELRDLANEAGYFRKGESPGRATHGQILQLTRTGRLRKKGEAYILGPEVFG